MKEGKLQDVWIPGSSNKRPCFNQGPFMDGAEMEQKDQGCLGRRWHQCVARGGINFGKPTARAHQVSPSSDGFSSSHHGKKHLEKFNCRIWVNYKVWRWACEGSFPPCETPNFSLRRENWFLNHPSLTSIQAFPIWRKELFEEELRSTKPAWFIWRSKRECCLWDKDGSALKGFSFVQGCPPTTGTAPPERHPPGEKHLPCLPQGASPPISGCLHQRESSCLTFSLPWSPAGMGLHLGTEDWLQNAIF